MKSIVKLPNNDCWYFYHDTSNGICFSALDSEANIKDVSVLSADSPDDFDVTADSEGNIHLCCQNSVGDILYFRKSKDVWSKTTVLKSKNNSQKNKNFHIFSINGWINILCMLDYRGKNMLIHHILRSGGEAPEVIDYIRDSYTACCDPYGNIHIYYDSEINNSFGSKKYIWSQKKWTEFNPEQRFVGFDTLVVLFDSEGKANCAASKNSEIHYISENKDEIISSGEKPVLHYVNNSWIIQWEYRGKIHSAMIRKSRTRPEKCGEYNISKRCIPDVYKLCCPDNYDIIAEYCYGYREGDKVILPGLEDICKGKNIVQGVTLINNPEAKYESISNEYQAKLDAFKNDARDFTYEYGNENRSKSSDDITLSKIMIAVNSAVDTLSRIEKGIYACEKRLENIEQKIKEPPYTGDSPKRKFIRW